MLDLSVSSRLSLMGLLQVLGLVTTLFETLKTSFTSR